MYCIPEQSLPVYHSQLRPAGPVWTVSCCPCRASPWSPLLWRRWQVERPRAVAVLPLEGRLLWVDQGAPPRIETARLDGSQRRRLVTEALQQPTGLAASRQR